MPAFTKILPFSTGLLLLLLLLTSLPACSSSDDTSPSGDGDRERVDLSEPDGDMDADEEIVADGDGEDAEQSDAADSENDAEAEIEAPPAVTPAECLADSTCEQRMVTAHRGYKITHPENSLAAIRDAAAVGAEFAEVDVRDTADEALVLMHDSDVTRTTDGAGNVSDLTLEAIRALLLDGGEAGNPESERVPLFSEALSLARELNIMLYVDQKTGRTDLVLAAIRNGEYFAEALVRDDPAPVIAMAAEEPRLWVMPAVEDEAGFNAVLEAIPNLAVVEVGTAGIRPDLVTIIRNAGVKAQQDIMVGDLSARVGDYSTWKSYVDSGIWLLQTDLPQLLVPAVEICNREGEFPSEGPGLLR